MASKSQAQRRETLNIRIKPDRTLITVSPEAYREFVKRLDAKPRPNARLRKTMQAAASWERDDARA